MIDPLLHLFTLFGFDHKLIGRVEAGAKYVGVMLKNGQIGVCSTLGHQISAREVDFVLPDLSNPVHRIVYNACLNAMLNYDAKYEDQKDIFQHIDFSGRNRIVMIGFFRPLVKKFREAGIDLSIFDLHSEDEALTPNGQLDAHLSLSGTVILTSTTLFTGTFGNIISKTPVNCDIFLLGPSSPLHPELKKYRNVKKIYGAIFELHDHRILDIIAAGHGTQTFLKHGKKVNI